MCEDAPQREYPLRELFNGLRYVIRYGIAWRAMPHDLPPWSAVYQQTQRWLAGGCFEALAQDLRAVLRIADGRAADPSVAIIDSRTLRSTPESGPRSWLRRCQTQARVEAAYGGRYLGPFTGVARHTSRS
jgi:transposase